MANRDVMSLQQAFPNLSVTISLSELRQVMGELFAEELARARAEADNKRDDELLTQEQAAKMLGVSTNTLWRWDKMGILHPVRMGRRVSYRYGELITIARRGCGVKRDDVAASSTPEHAPERKGGHA